VEVTGCTTHSIPEVDNGGCAYELVHEYFLLLEFTKTNLSFGSAI
jgi:hypothetical protein